MSEHRTLHHPFGFDQGDPLIICRDSMPETLRASATRLGIKGFYIGYGAMIGGRRFNQVYIDLNGVTMHHAEFVMFWRWIVECVMTTIPPATQFKGVTFV